MPSLLPGSADALNKFEDLSGVDTTSFSNPYDALIEACQDDPAKIQSRYSIHRVTRNAKQKESLLSPDFKGLILDTILQRLEDPSIEPGFADPRNSVVIWARPPTHIKSLINEIQQRLKKVAPNLWSMPIPNVHLTALEITHSVTSAETASIVSRLQPILSELTDLTYNPACRARLIKPLVSYDGAAVALSFLPAAGESLAEPNESLLKNSAGHPRQASADKFTYHHLRQRIFSLCTSAGVTIESRYVVPSAHLTIVRFVTTTDHDDHGKMERWLNVIEEINAWLQREYWPKANGDELREGGEWIVGQEKGLDFRMGTLWYGGGETMRLGKGVLKFSGSGNRDGRSGGLWQSLLVERLNPLLGVRAMMV